MAESNIDNILVRLDEIEKLQAELRHLVPQVASNSSRHQNLLHRDSSSSIRFPSLFTFPVASNFAASSKKERVLQKSAAQLNLADKFSGNERSSTVTLKNVGRPLKSKSSAKEINIYKGLLKSTNVAKSRERYSLPSKASTSITAKDPKRSTPMPYTKSIAASRMTKNSQGAIGKRLKSETSRTAARDKMQRAIGERSNIQLSKNENITNSSEYYIKIWAFLEQLLC